MKDRDPARAACIALRRVRKSLCCSIRALQEQNDPAFIAGFGHLVARVEAGLRHEETMLERCGDACLHAWREDNATILCALHRVHPRVESGDVALGRRVAASLYQVLALHRMAIDLALLHPPWRRDGPRHPAPMRARPRRQHAGH